jgi:hypothetical protein
LDALTRSNSERARNDAARGSVLLALLGLDQFSLLQATGATCGSAVLGGAAVLLARRGLRNIERTLGRLGGESAARVGRLLGTLSLCLGVTAGLALGVYALLNLFG